jgi:hypothetical protein
MNCEACGHRKAPLLTKEGCRRFGDGVVLCYEHTGLSSPRPENHPVIPTKDVGMPPLLRKEGSFARTTKIELTLSMRLDAFSELSLRRRQADDGLGVWEFAFERHLSGVDEGNSVDLYELV